MNALIRKEIRLILPGWIGATILALVPVCLMQRSVLFEILNGKDMGYVFVSFWLFMGLIFPALASFGHEFNFATFPGLLSQPVSRREIWRLKVGVLVTANLLVVVAFFGALLLRFSWLDPVQLDSMGPLMWSAALFAGVAMSGGLWTTLLLRQTAAAFWLTLMVPGFLVVAIVIGLALGLYQDVSGKLVSGLFIIYSTVGFFGARGLFYGAQDAGWSGPNLAMPQFPWAKTTTTVRVYRPMYMLYRKELQLQQVTLIIAGAMALIHLLDLGARNMFINRFPQCRNLLEAVPFLWLLLPVITGSVAIAEERKLGTLEGQLCAPIRRGWQFAIKLAVVSCIGLFSGAFAPVLFEALGRKAGTPGGVDMVVITEHYTGPSPILVIGSLALSWVSFYASSLSRNTLQALGKAIAFACILYVILGLFASPPSIEDRPLWGYPMADAIGSIVGPLTILALAWSNFGHLHFGARIWRRNILTLFTALALTLAVSSFAYNRIWETWLPDEPNHEWSARKPETGALIEKRGRNCAIVAKSHNLWIKDQVERTVPGDDWSAVVVSTFDICALKTDGSLWNVSAKPQAFLSETRWKQIVPQGDGIAGLKTDGTIWRWQRAQGDAASRLRQLGHDNDWTLICGGANSITVAKADESIWRFSSTNKSASVREVPLQLIKPSPHKIISMTTGFYWGSVCAIMDDKTLWASDERGGWEQVGRDADWVEAQEIGGRSLVGLKENGTLWLFRHRLILSEEGKIRVINGSQYLPYSQEPISPYHVWTGISGSDIVGDGDDSYEAILALADDGKLCQWRLFSAGLAFPSEFARPNSWMAQSRLRATTWAKLDLESN